MSLLLSFTASLLVWTGIVAGAVAEPWGHWEGSITGQFGTLRIELDLSRSADGAPTARFSAPDRHLNGIPVVTLTLNGRAITFEPAAVHARFQGELSENGDEISGTFEAAAGAVPVTLVRRGDARIAEPPKSAAIAAQLEGTWNGTLDVDGGKRVRLTMVNQPDGMSSGTMVSLDEDNLELPIAITQTGQRVKLDVPAVSSTYAATLSADGLELVGTYATPQGIELPLTLRKK